MSKAKVQEKYGNAKCERKGDCFFVFTESKILAKSFISAAHAWKLALVNITKEKKLSRRQERIAFKILNGDYQVKSAENSPNIKNRNGI